MLRGMTAYARLLQETVIGHVEAELHCVNRKHLDIRVDLPRRLRRFEAPLRKLISSQIDRGQVTLFLNLSATEQQRVRPNLPLLQQLGQAAKEMAANLNFDPQICFDGALRAAGAEILLFEEPSFDEKALASQLETLVSQLLKLALKVKDDEGAATVKELNPRIELLSERLSQIAEKAAGATDSYRIKLQERLCSILEEPKELQDRLLREVAIYADRIDISEEVARFRHHLTQLQGDFSSKAIASGKRAEFTLQELNREANTIGSKVQDAKIAQLVVDIKGELEKIREQVQNVE